MRQAELAVGLAFLFVGISVAIYGYTLYNDLPVYQIRSEGTDWRNAVTVIVIGVVLGVIGIIIAVMGLGKEPAMRTSGGGIVFADQTSLDGKYCSFCGNLCAPEVMTCPKCGRRFE